MKYEKEGVEARVLPERFPTRFIATFRKLLLLHLPEVTASAKTAQSARAAWTKEKGESSGPAQASYCLSYPLASGIRARE